MANPAPIRIEIIADTKGAEASYDNLIKAQKGLDTAAEQYARTLLNLDRIEKAGLTTQSRVNKLIAEAGNEYKRASTQAAAYAGATTRVTNNTQKMTGVFGRFGNISRQTRGSVQQVSFQLQDIAVQLQAGTALSTTLAQQLPQLAGAFGAVGAAVGVLAAIGIPAVSFAMKGLIGTTREFEDILSSVEDTIKNLETPLNVLSLTMRELTEQFGTGAQRAREWALAQAEIRIGIAESNLRENLIVLRETTKELQGLRPRNIEGVSVAMMNLRKELGLSIPQAQELALAFGDLHNAQTVDEQADSLQRMLNFLKEAGVSLSEMPSDLQRAIDEMIELQNATARARTLMSELRGEAANIMVGGPDLAIQDVRESQELTGVVSTTRISARRPSGRRSPRERQLDSLVESLKTEREIVEEWRMEGLELLRQANAAELEELGGFNEAKLRLEKEYQERLARIKEAGNQNDVQSVLKGGSQILAAIGQTNDKALRLSKVFAAAEALVSTYKGAAKELEKGTLGFATAAALIAKGIGFVSAIKGVNPGSSGAVPAGGSGAASQASSAPQASQGPLQVSVNTLGPSEIVNLPNFVSSLADALGNEYRDRGVVFV